MEKHSQEEAEPRRNTDMEKVRREKIKNGEPEERRCSCAKKAGRLRNIVFVPMFCGSGRPKSRLAKAAGAEPAGQMKDEKLHAVVARSTLEVKRGKTPFRIMGFRF